MLRRIEGGNLSVVIGKKWRAQRDQHNVRGGRQSDDWMCKGDVSNEDNLLSARRARAVIPCAATTKAKGNRSSSEAKRDRRQLRPLADRPLCWPGREFAPSSSSSTSCFERCRARVIGLRAGRTRACRKTSCAGMQRSCLVARPSRPVADESRLRCLRAPKDGFGS